MGWLGTWATFAGRCLLGDVCWALFAGRGLLSAVSWVLSAGFCPLGASELVGRCCWRENKLFYVTTKPKQKTISPISHGRTRFPQVTEKLRLKEDNSKLVRKVLCTRFA